MAAARHYCFHATVRWTGNQGEGTRSYTAYGRDHVISAKGKPDIPSSADAAFRGDATRWNPEDMLVGSLSACHMLWFLHLAAEAGIIVTDYVDDAEGEMEIIPGAHGGGRFTRVTLRPRVTIAAGGDSARALSLHEMAHERCFIANSVNFPVTTEPVIDVGQTRNPS